MGFQVRYKETERVSEIITPIGISIPFTTEEDDFRFDDQRIVQTKALWVTRATHSVITRAIAAKVGLKPIGKAIIYHAGGQDRVNTKEEITNSKLKIIFASRIATRGS